MAMASEAALARDYHVSEALTQAIADPAFNLQLRKPPLPRKRVVTYSKIPIGSSTPRKPEGLAFGENVLSYVAGPAYDRKSEVVQAGEAWLGGKASFVPAAPDAEKPVRPVATAVSPRRRSPGARSPMRIQEAFPVQSMVRVTESPQRGVRQTYERPWSARSRASSRERPWSAGSRTSLSRPGSAGSRGGHRPPTPSRTSVDHSEWSPAPSSARSSSGIPGARWRRVSSVGSFVHGQRQARGAVALEAEWRGA